MEYIWINSRIKLFDSFCHSSEVTSLTSWNEEQDFLYLWFNDITITQNKNQKMQPSKTINTPEQVVEFPSKTTAFLYLNTSTVVSDGQSTI
jgi:hypothetical protein